MAVELKFSKLDHAHWGFRLTGGSDCNMPLTVVKVSEGSIAEQVGLKENDIIIKINDVDIDNLSHDEAHEIILYAGNSFIATIVRNQINQIQQSSIDIGSEILPLPEPSSFTNDINQVPNPGTRTPINTYKPFSNKTFPDIPPLESPLIFSEKLRSDFQTINQKEWKEFSSKQTKTATIEQKSNSNLQIQVQGELNHIDIKEIENSVKESVDESTSKYIELSENSQTLSNIEKHIVSSSNDTDICNKNDNIQKTEVLKTNNTSEKSLNEQKSSQESVTINECVMSTTSESKKIHENLTNIDIYDKSKEISLENAKMEAIKAANTLSKQAKVNGINTFEGTKMGTVDAFKTLSENMQHKCSAVPCEALKLETQSQTDLLLKTFFVHLTDVMVALTQMITHDHAIKCCSKACGPYCMCLKKTENLNEENISIMKSNNEKSIDLSETQVNEEKSTVFKTDDKINTESKSSNTEYVLKEVINNIQSATGVDVTVNGKDPLEWLADLDENKMSVKKIESSSEKLVMNETIKREVEAKSEVEVKSEVVSKIVENTSLINEVKQNKSINSLSSEITQENCIETNDSFKESKDVRSGWDVKVASKDPQTPNTDEYVFRLDIKLKGKLPDAPNDILEVDEPKLHEDLSIVRRPTFTIGDVQIEKSTNKVAKDLDKKILKIRDIQEINSPESEVPSIDNKKMYEAIVTDVKTTCYGEILNVKESSEFKSCSFEESINENNETVTIAENYNLNIANQNLSNIVHTNLSNSEIFDSTHNSTAYSDTKTCNTNVTDNTNTVISSIPASANGFTNGLPASAYNSAGSCSIANDQEAVHETVLTMTENNMESSQNLTFTNKESSVLIEESASQVKTMGEASKNYASISNGGKIININNEPSYEDIGKPGLNDEEISEIISGSAHDIREQHLVGLTKVLASHMSRPDDEINSCEPKDLVPQCIFLKDSEVFKALNEENLRIKAERLQEGRKKWTSFLQKPNRPIPFCKKEAERLEFQEPPYKVNIKRQDKNDKIEKTSSVLTEGLFLVPEVPILIPEPQPQYFEAPEYLPDTSFPDLEDTGIKIPEKCLEKVETPVSTDFENEEEITDSIITDSVAETLNENDKNIIAETICEKEVCDENLSVEEQLANVQKQLVALSMLPITIQQTLDQVTKKITQIVTKSNTEQISEVLDECSDEKEEIDEIMTDEISQEETILEEKEILNEVDENCQIENDAVNENQVIKETDESETTEICQLETCKLEVKEKIEAQEDKNIHELRKDLINELNEEHAMRQVKQRPGGRVGRPRPAFGPLTPQERPIVLPGGRKWRGPKDAFTDSFIAETLSGQAEVIKGKALGNHIEYIYPPYNDRVNFMKYAKPPVTLDHIKSSSVYKLIHDEEQLLHGVQARGVVLAESDYREKCRSITPTSFNKQDLSIKTEVI